MGRAGSALRSVVDAVPTSGDDWRLLGRTLREVFARPPYVLLAIGSAAAALTLFVVSQNYAIVRDFVLLGELAFFERLSFLWDLYPLAGPAYTREHSLLLIGVASLIGVNVALLGYQLAELQLVASEGVGGAAGMVLGTLGAGCAACGTAVLGGVLSVFGVTGALALLPYDGMEFLVLAIGVMIVSAYSIATSIATDAACPVDID